MNNDFNYKPPQQPDPAADDTARSAPSVADEPTGAASEQPQVITSSPKSSGAGKKLGLTLLVLILLAAAAGGVYYWQNQQVKAAQASQATAEKQVSSLQSQLDKKSKAPSTSPTPAPGASGTATTAPNANVITGNADTITNVSANVTVQYIPNKATEVWVEYGTAPDKLTTLTPHQKVSSEGTLDAYVGQPYKLNGLKPGTQYFYRAAGLVNGQTVDGGVVSFTTTK